MADKERKHLTAPQYEGEHGSSRAEYRELTEVPGYRLRKGIEVALFRVGGGFVATHCVPSTIGNGRGTELNGMGRTEDEAAKALGQRIAVVYENLKERAELGNVPEDLAIGKSYLDSILYKTD